MKVVPSLLLTICVQLSSGLTLPVKRGDLLKRQSIENDDGEIECISMKRNPGEYYHISEGSPGVCGLYMVGETDSLIQVEFTQFNIDCQREGLLALVDGWELQSEFFPNIDDTGDSFEDRYKTFCGSNAPSSQVYVSSQNVALIQFRIPQEGQGFRVRVSFIHNPQPCNVMAMPGAGVMTIKNYGERRNCTMSIIYPENVLIMNVDIGTSVRGSGMEVERGLSLRCGGDFVEFLYGNGLDTGYMGRKIAFCGLKSKAARRHVTLGCHNTAVRLVSSGDYYNSITFSISKPSPEELDAFSQFC